MGRERLANAAFLDIATTHPDDLPEHVLLPHEQPAVAELFAQKEAQFQQVVADKQSVTGGDDWHDGAFRETDRQAQIITDAMAALSPYLLATVVEYPAADDDRVTLGSRVLVSQNNFEFPVDVIGLRNAYPADVIDPESGEEVEAVSIESPLGQQLIGKKAGESATYQQGDKQLTANIVRIDQTAVSEYFMSESGVELVTPEVTG
jgi:transcription elongation GreA/GreB family factor